MVAHSLQRGDVGLRTTVVKIWEGLLLAKEDCFGCFQKDLPGASPFG